VGSKLDAVDKRIILTIYEYGKPISKLKLHRIIYELKNRGVRFPFQFYGERPIAPELDERLEKLVNRGYLRKLYYTGPSYLTLYTELYRLTPKGLKIAEKADIDKRDVKRIKDYFNERKSAKLQAPAPGEGG